MRGGYSVDFADGWDIIDLLSQTEHVSNSGVRPRQDTSHPRWSCTLAVLSAPSGHCRQGVKEYLKQCLRACILAYSLLLCPGHTFTKDTERRKQWGCPCCYLEMPLFNITAAKDCSIWLHILPMALENYLPFTSKALLPLICWQSGAPRSHSFPVGSK